MVDRWPWQPGKSPEKRVLRLIRRRGLDFAKAISYIKSLMALLTLMRPARKAATLLVGVVLAAGLTACGAEGGASVVTSNRHADLNHGRFSAPVKGGTYAEEHPGFAAYGTPPLEFEADPGGELAFTSGKVMAKEGNVAIEFTNPQSTPQNLAIEIVPRHEKIVSETIEDGFTAMGMTLNAKERYVYYSTLPGHRKAGMEGVIIVTPR